MIRFLAGERVVIRYGGKQGKKATIMTSQPGDGYKVKVEDGAILYYSSKGLEKEKTEVRQVVA